MKKRLQPPKNRKRIQEYISPKEYVVSLTEIIEIVKTGAWIVWVTIKIFTISLILIAIVLSLLIAFFVAPESRQDILGVIERLFGELLGGY